MQNELSKIGRHPDLKGDGCAGWINKDKNGNKFITVVALNSIRFNLFKNVPKPKPDFEEELI